MVEKLCDSPTEGYTSMVRYWLAVVTASASGPMVWDWSMRSFSLFRTRLERHNDNNSNAWEGRNEGHRGTVMQCIEF